MKIENILSIPEVYTLWQKIVGDDKLRKVYTKDFIKAAPGSRVLDIGCGPANMVKYLDKNVQYTGFDESESYINHARKIFSQNNYKFFCQSVNCVENFDGKFDIVMANAILHHIDDNEALKLISFAHKNLKEGGRLVTYDGCYTKNQSKVARFLLEHDRGKFVRTQQEYENLFNKYFSNIKVTIRDDLYNIPYTIIIFECARSTELL